MKKALLALIAVGLLAAVWYDGVQHGYTMFIEDSCATPRWTLPADRTLRL